VTDKLPLSPNGRTLCERLFGSASPKVRLSAVIALGKLLASGDRSVIPCIRAVFVDPYKPVRAVAAEALQYATLDGETARDLTDRLTCFAQDLTNAPCIESDALVRRYMVESLRKILLPLIAVPGAERDKYVPLLLRQRVISNLAQNAVSDPDLGVRAVSELAARQLRPLLSDTQEVPPALPPTETPPPTQPPALPPTETPPTPRAFTSTSTAGKVLFGLGVASVLGLIGFFVINRLRRPTGVVTGYRRGGDVW